MTDNPPLYLVTVAVELHNAEDRKLFHTKLCEFALEEDFSFAFKFDEPTGQFLLIGRDEYHLLSVIGHIVGNAPIEIKVGAPQIAYRETITRAETVDYTDKGRLGGDVRVKLFLEPLASIIDENFKVDFVDSSISKEYSRAIRQGIAQALDKGPLGFRVIGLRVKVMMIDYRNNGPGITGDAVRRAIEATLLRDKTCLLEPFVKVEVDTHEKYRGDIIADLCSRRGRIDEQSENELTVVATVPISSLFGYRNTLRSLTGTEAKWTMSFSHYEPIVSPDDPRKQPAMIMRVVK
jgi:elongation factor G